MPESEEDLRRYLREKVAEEKQAAELARWRRPGLRLGGYGRIFLPWLGSYDGEVNTRLTTLDPLFGDATLSEDAPAAEASGAEAPPSTPPPAPPSVETPPNPAPVPSSLPPPRAALPAAPPAPVGQTVPLILRASAVFILVITLGVIALLAQRTTKDPTVWIAAGMGLAVCAALLFLAGRQRRDPGNPPIVS